MGSRILDVPYKSQNDPDAQGVFNDCGPACIATLLATQGQNVATSDVYAASGVTQDRPLSFAEVRTAAARYDLPLSWRLDVRLQDVQNYIDQGTPVIALVKYLYLPDRQGQSTTTGHFVLVVGYDDDAREIIINDPYYWGPLRSKGDHHHYDYDTWEQAWGRCQEDGNPNHSILIPQLNQPVPAIESYTQPEPLPGVTTVYVLPAADAYNGLKLRPARSSDVSGPAVFSGRALTVVQGPVTEGDAAWALVRTQSSGDVAGWACIRRGSEAYIGNARNATTAATFDPVAPPASVAYVQPAVEKYGGLKLRPMRDIRLDGPVAHAGAALNVLAEPVGSGDNQWLLVTMQDGKDTAGWVRVRQGAETYVSESQQIDITPAPTLGEPRLPAALGDVWVIAPAGLVLRPQPSAPLVKGMGNLLFGTHLTAVSAEAGLDEKGRTWLQVRTDRGVVGWIPASASGERLIADSKPADPYSVQVLDTPPVRQAGGLRVRDTRNIDSPELDKAVIGERLTVYVRATEADGTPWLWVQSPRGKYGWAREKSGSTVLVGGPQPVEAGGETTPAESRVTQVDWPYGKCLVGVGVANPQLLEGPDMEALRRGSVEAIKLLTLPDPDQGVEVLNQVRSLYPNAFVVCRLMAQFGIRIEPPLFVEIVGEAARKLYKRGVRYFEVHNEPNLPQEGLGVSWANGAEFGAWFIQVCDLLRPSMPEAKFGWPGVSPQPNVPDFLDGAIQALRRADWIGIHCYWQTDGTGHWQMRSGDGGMYWRGFCDRYPDKLLMITEFSCNNPNVSYADKGRQYAEYFRLLRHEPNMGVAFSFALHWPGQDNNREGWVSEGNVTDIPGVMASIVSQPGFLD